MTEQKLVSIINRLNVGAPTDDRGASYVLEQCLHTLAETGADETFGPILRQWTVERIVQAIEAINAQRLTVPSEVLQAALFAIKWNQASKN
jgi:hypothetical protein